jgi:hypothetical protein
MDTWIAGALARLDKTGDNRMMARALGIVVALLVVGAAPRAHADVLLFYGDLHAGGMYGKGIGGDQKSEAFFENAPNGMYGFAVGGRFLSFLGAEIQHHQYAFIGGTDGSDLRTWTQIMGGLDFNVGLGSEKEKKAGTESFIQVSAMAGFGVGTGQQIMPPLDNAQVTDKGFLLGGKLGYGKHLSKFVDFGVLVPVAYGYYFKNGVSASDVTNQYQGIHVEGLLYLRLNIKLL